VVGVQEGHPRPARLAQGLVAAGVLAAIFLVPEEAQARIAEAGERRARAVGRAVVDDEALPARVGLRQHGAHRGGAGGGAVVRRDDDRKERLAHPSLSADRMNWTPIAASSRPIRRVMMLRMVGENRLALAAAKVSVQYVTSATSAIRAKNTALCQTVAARWPSTIEVVIAPGPASRGTAKGVTAMLSLLMPSANSSGVSFSGDFWARIMSSAESSSTRPPA